MGSTLLEKTPLLESYIQRCLARPGIARAQAKDN
jgi:hypothetical protein